MARSRTVREPLDLSGAELVRAVLAAYGCRSERLGAMVGCTGQTVRRWAKGLGEPRLSEAQRLRDLLVDARRGVA
jgi:hypothetical protein